MKRLISYILVASIIGGAFHLDELMRLPFLIGHYSEHKLLHPDDSVAGFLYKHYILNQQAESEQDKKSDSQMPFKSEQSFQSHLMLFAIENNMIQVSFHTTIIHFILFDKAKITSGFFDIWQPPKVS